MADWITFDVSDMPIRPAVEAITADLVAPLETTASLASAAALLMGALALIAAPTVDPLGPFLRDQIDQLINDLVGSGVFGLVISPDLHDKGTANKGPDGFLRTIKEAMNDQGDTNRPKFEVGDTSSGIIFLISAPSFSELAAVAEGFQALFGSLWTDLINFTTAAPVVTPHRRLETTGVVTSLVPGEDPAKVFIDSSQNFTVTQGNYDPYKGQLIIAMNGRNTGDTTRIKSFNNATKTFTLDPGFRYQMEVGNGYGISYNVEAKPPDWKSYRLVDAVPVVADVVEILAQVRDSMPAYGGSTQYSRLEIILQRKADLFNALAADIKNLIDLFNRLDSVTGVHMLPIPPQDKGNIGFTREAFAAGNVPPVGPTDYTLGVVLYGGSGVFDTLRKIFPI